MNNSNFPVIFTLASQVLIMHCENRFGFGTNNRCTVPISVEMGFFLTVCPCLITCCPRHQQQNWEKFLQGTFFFHRKGLAESERDTWQEDHKRPRSVVVPLSPAHRPSSQPLSSPVRYVFSAGDYYIRVH